MRGGLSFDKSRERLSIFIEQGFKVKDVLSAVLAVSVRTVEKGD